MADFEQLGVWRLAHEICLETYTFIHQFPTEERFALAQQMRRAAASVPTNIAEGNERPSPADFCHFMDIALGSVAELRYQLILARDLGYITPTAASELATKLSGLVRMLREFKTAGGKTRKATRRP